MATTNSHRYSFLLVFIAIFVVPLNGQLSPNFYRRSCPMAPIVVRNAVLRALSRDPRMGASLLRLHFHDCFVNGCDGSVLLDDTSTFTGEKTAIGNGGLRGFEVIDQIKATLNEKCGNVVSCADILALTVRDSIAILGGPIYKLPLGRRDARTASLDDATANLPPPFFDFPQLLTSFKNQGLNLKDLVALSGGHTIGSSSCRNFRNRIWNETNIDPNFAANARRTCPQSGGNNNRQGFDATPARFDNQFFKDLLNLRGLLHSDQELFRGDGGASDRLVRKYARNRGNFAKDFEASIIKMGKITPLTGSDGEIRKNCRIINDIGLHESM